MSSVTSAPIAPVSPTSAEPQPLSFAELDGLTAPLVHLRSALGRHLDQPADQGLWLQLLGARRAAAQAISRLPKRSKDSADVASARKLVRDIAAAGILDAPADAAERELADDFLPLGWPGLLAAMTLLPAWQWHNAPAFQSVPDWLWGDYAAWLFAAPQGFAAPGQAERYAAHILRRSEELLAWVYRNRGSAAVREALAAYTVTASHIPLYFNSGNLRPHAVARGLLLTAAQKSGAAADLPPLPLPRAGRRLRVGFVNRHFGSQTETYTTLPTFEYLDPARFDVTLYALHENPGPLENYCRARAAGFQVLPGDLAGQLAALRAAALDVVVFGTNVTAVVNEVARLALHRVAPLQVVNNSSCITSGLPEIDLYVSGTLTEAPGAEAQFTERLGLLPGPAHAFNYQADAGEPTVAPTRAQLGIPDDAFVFVTAANYYKIVPEMQVAWAKLLAAVPGSYLLVHPFNPNWSSHYPINRFCAEFDRVLAARGVDSSRLIVSANRFPSRTDVKELLRLGDVYLDTFPFGGVNSLVDPLELGLPVVVWEGDTFRSRMASALLRELKVSGLTAANEAEYLALAAKLAGDPDARRTVSAQIAAAMQAGPLFLDSLAASDAFGRLLETAYDELCEKGAEAFRAESAPLLVRGAVDVANALEDGARALSLGLETDAADAASEVLAVAPAHPHARALLGRALLARHETARAVDYLLGAVQHLPDDAALWFDLSRALRQNNQMPQAIEALKAAIERDPSRLEAWLTLIELAQRMGANELVREAFDIARQIDPADPRIASLAATLAA